MTESVGAIGQKLKTDSCREEKYLLFSLTQESYGISILKIIEIIGVMPITVLPQTPDYYKGVINLRGRVIPVVDLRIKFGLGASKYDDRSCIVIVRVESKHISRLVGLMVDSVSEVLNIPKSDIEPPPAFGQNLNNRFIEGVSKHGGSVKILLDVDAVLSTDEAFMLEHKLIETDGDGGEHDLLLCSPP